MIDTCAVCNTVQATTYLPLQVPHPDVQGFEELVNASLCPTCYDKLVPRIRVRRLDAALARRLIRAGGIDTEEAHRPLANIPNLPTVAA